MSAFRMEFLANWGDRSSQVAQPGQIPTSCPQCHKPAAWEVKNRNSKNPHRVNKRQTMAVSRGPLSEVYTEVTMQYRLVRDQRDHYSDYVNEIKVQNVVEERYPTVYQQDASKSAHSFRAVK